MSATSSCWCRRWSTSTSTPRASRSSVRPVGRPLVRARDALFRAGGTTGDVPVPGEWTVTSTSSTTPCSASTGRWYVDGQPFVAYGHIEDIPVPADYDRRADGLGGVPAGQGPLVRGGRPEEVQLGNAFVDPGPGQWDDDPELDFAVYLPDSGALVRARHRRLGRLGPSGDVPVLGQWDGDRYTDIGNLPPVHRAVVGARAAGGGARRLARRRAGSGPMGRRR